MTDKPEPPPILNPRYGGATPEMVARALLKNAPEDEKQAEPGDSDFQSSI